MSDRTYADCAYEIFPSILENHIPGILEEINNNYDELIEYLQDDEMTLEQTNSNVQAIINKVLDFGKVNGLDLNFGYRSFDEDETDDEGNELFEWYVYCNNAVTINPVFSKIGGKLSLWTTWG